jgi:hypothetical protein
MKFASSVACRTAAAAAILALSATCALATPGVVNTTVNLRQGPGTNTPVLAKIPGGAPVDVTSCSGEWCQVTFAGKGGYVIATALAHGGPPPGAPPPGYVPPPAAVYVAPPPYYGPYYYGPYWGWGGGGCCWHGGWGRRW